MEDASSAKKPEEPSSDPMRPEEVLPADAVNMPKEGMIGPTRIEARLAFSAKSRMMIRGLNGEQEKEKVSLTLDRALIEALRSSAGPKRLSATVNELLLQAVERAQLRALVEELENEAGPASADAYQELLDEWFADAE